jgi:hypothetical protein
MFDRLIRNLTQNGKNETNDDPSKALDLLQKNASVLDEESMSHIKGGDTQNNHQRHLDQLELRIIPGGNTPS